MVFLFNWCKKNSNQKVLVLVDLYLEIFRSETGLKPLPKLFLSPTRPPRKIRLIESNSKCRQKKIFTWFGTLRQVFICLRPSSLLGYCLRWSSNFVGFEFGQIQSVKLLHNMVSNRTQHPPLPPSHTLSVYTVLWLWEGGRSGGGEPERRIQWQSWVENTNMTDCTSSL